MSEILISIDRGLSPPGFTYLRVASEVDIPMIKEVCPLGFPLVNPGRSIGTLLTREGTTLGTALFSFY